MTGDSSLEDDWYKAIPKNEGILQGDILFDCPIIVPKTADELIWDSLTQAKGKGKHVIKGDLHFYDVVVMSQSCDIVQGKVDLILLCPFWSLREFHVRIPKSKEHTFKEQIRRGFVPRYSMINRCSIKNCEIEISIVDFGEIYSMPLKTIREFAGRSKKRLQLKSPYKEHLSQAFARFFMRVGLPSDIPEFVKSDERKEETTIQKDEL